jgi:hypothetical protein
MLESGLCPVIVIGARRRRAGRLIGTWFTSLRCAVAVVVPVVVVVTFVFQLLVYWRCLRLPRCVVVALALPSDIVIV